MASKEPEGRAPASAKLFRNIIERSAMVNNDEHVFYTSQSMTPDEAHPIRLVISRPVYDVEIDAGLDTKKGGDMLGRDEPDVTRLIDAYWRVKAAFSGYARMSFDPDKAVIHHIAYNFYDCMSGGCPEYVVSIMRYACAEFGVPGDAEVYPGGDNGWHTVADFLAETDGAPDLRDVIGDGTKCLPTLIGLPGPPEDAED